MARHMPDQGRVFVQAESEISAISMVYGASAAGAQAMTSSSSPGISLKQEGISYISGADLPAVIVNIMRGGPGLGNIMPSQSDYFQATRGGGHGDYRNIVLAPSSVQEAYELMFRAFNLSEKYRIPVMVLGDGTLGQMMEPIVTTQRVKASGRKVKPWALTGCKGRKPNIIKSFYMKEGDLETFNLGLQKKYKKIIQKEQQAEKLSLADAKVVVVAYGTMARISKSVIMQLRRQGKKIGLIRPISLWPFPSKAFAGTKKQTKFLVAEMSYGQMAEDVRLTVNGRGRVEFIGRSGGGVPTEAQLIKKINQLIR